MVRLTPGFAAGQYTYSMQLTVQATDTNGASHLGNDSKNFNKHGGDIIFRSMGPRDQAPVASCT